MRISQRVAFIVPYFGTLPGYFQLFLDSCRYNPKFEWLIFTNDCTPYDYPANVHQIQMDFGECKAIVQAHFDFEITLSKPQKLCDYKCAYGYIFQDYLTEYDWWGHCDLDQIFGDLGAFITEEMLAKYDKIGSLGHLTLYRNTLENNQIFMSKLNGRLRYKDVFTTELGCAFDEWLPDNINEIYLESGRPIMLENAGADLNAYRTTFQTVDFGVEKRHYVKSEVKNSIFQWDSGKLRQIYLKGRTIEEQEFPYVHLQKRRMKDSRGNRTGKVFYIVPNRFVDGNVDARKQIMRGTLQAIVNVQYFRVKFASLRYRIKSGNWTFNNVFR